MKLRSVDSGGSKEIVSYTVAVWNTAEHCFSLFAVVANKYTFIIKF